MNTKALISLTYISVSSKELTSPELRDFLTEIRGKNERQGITGMLLYKAGDFLQIIEGPEPTIDKLLIALREDPRHNGMIVLAKERINQCEFSEWQMAFHDITKTDLRSIEGYSPFMELPFTDSGFQAEPQRCQKLLMYFRSRTR